MFLVFGGVGICISFCSGTACIMGFVGMVGFETGWGVSTVGVVGGVVWDWVESLFRDKTANGLMLCVTILVPFYKNKFNNNITPARTVDVLRKN